MIKKITILFVFIFVTTSFSQQMELYDYIQANNIKMWVGAMGDGSHDPRTDDSGLFWGVDAFGKPLSAVFSDGPLIGFKIGDSTFIHGATYRQGLQGVPFGPPQNGVLNSIAKVASDWKNETDPLLREKYKLFNDNYPTFLGAPFRDNDGNGFYNPEIDNPEYLGEQTLWWTSNANNSSYTQWLFGASAINLEIQTTVWAEKVIFPDVVYKEYLFINHESDSLKDFYFGYWSDPDVGYLKDDYVGVDTVLGMMYAYNSDDNDENFYADEPASVGYLLLDGPVISATNNDTARYNGDLIKRKKNLNLSSFTYFVDDVSPFHGDAFGFYVMGLQVYNHLRGKIWNGDPRIDPTTGDSTTFSLAGDPITGEGWYEGDGWPGGEEPADRTMLMSAGPFDMAPGDTNCVTFAICLARDTGRLNSLAKLKHLATDVKSHWLYEVERTFPKSEIIQREPEIPSGFVVSNNYPNPFNNVTNINLELPESGNIKVTLFNTLGEVVRKISEHSPTAGYKSIQLNGAGLSSGVYYYTVLFRGETKLGKFVLMK